eukprot:3647633-Pyramimonas_sp.AAC.1
MESFKKAFLTPRASIVHPRQTASGKTKRWDSRDETQAQAAMRSAPASSKPRKVSLMRSARTF